MPGRAKVRRAVLVLPGMACAGEDPERWFSADPATVAAAAAVCAACPVRGPCGKWADAYREYGMWGGVRHEPGR